VGATYPRDVAAVRDVAPGALILLPGVGAQAGDLEESVTAGMDAHGRNAIVNASRTVLYASSKGDWQAAARSEAARLRAAINAARTQGATVGR
jgi:orotidine-5'-phosphate decarboxylase